MKRLLSLIRVQQIREVSLVLILAITIILFGTQIRNYYSPSMYNRISGAVALITVVAVGQTLVVLTRNVDLSVGSIVGFTAYFLGKQLGFIDDFHPVLAVGMAMGVGGLMGLVNGLIVAYGRVPAIVVTLGTLAIYRGLLVEYSHSQSVATRDLPQWIKDVPNQSLFEVGSVEMRVLPVIAIVAVLIFQLVLIYTAFGRRLYAVGSSPEAAEIAGLPARRLVLMTFIISGALSGLGGFIYLARIGTITVDAARGLELQVVAAAVVGGVNIFGGSGTVFGALIRMRINEFWKDALLGIFIVAAVTTDTVLMARARTWWAKLRRQQVSPLENSAPPVEG
jgi:rhamnose transport system permease protein